MTASVPHSTPIPSAVLDQAVGWLMRFQAGEMSPAEQHTFEHWLNEDALHLAAWKRAEEVMQTFSMTPPTVGRHTLSTLSPASITKNRALRLLGIASTMMPLLNLLVRGDVSEI